jgi:diacylglycerol kinase
MWPLTQTEILFLALSYALILITELQNTSFEKALDKLHPELHDDIGASKDIAAAAVLTAGLFALCVVLVISAERFF